MKWSTLCTSSTLFIVLIIQLHTLKYVVAQGRNPCHNKRKLGDRSTCEVVHMPPAFCKQCVLKPTDVRGTFFNCSSIYDVESAGCRKVFRRYVSKNPCDELRKEQVADYDNNIESLDFFVYAICEECCDCIPVGSDPDTGYDSGDPLLDFKTRGNCGTHAAVDICKVWPNIKKVISRETQRPTQPEIDALPVICEPLQQWRNNRSSMTSEEKEMVPSFAHKFLKQLLYRTSCRDRTVWETCARLESDQNRI